MKNLTTYLIGAAAALVCTQLQASIVTIDAGGTPTSVPSLSDHETTGGEMVGMEVTAVFGSGLSETLAWTGTSATAGGVTGTHWDLSVDGDTFVESVWQFNFDSAELGSLTQISLSGASAFMVFDRATPGFGTANSARGRDYADDLPSGVDARVRYLDAVGIAGNDPVGDIWSQVVIDYTSQVDESFRFSLDTDRYGGSPLSPESAPQALVPIPAAGWLFGSALLVGLGGVARGKRKATR